MLPPRGLMGRPRGEVGREPLRGEPERGLGGGMPAGIFEKGDPERGLSSRLMA